MNLRLPLLAGLLFTAVPAFSLSFSFSYTFDADPNTVVYGAFEGDQTGNLIENITFTSLTVNGSSGHFGDLGSLLVGWLDESGFVFDGSGRFSANAWETNFIITDLGNSALFGLDYGATGIRTGAFLLVVGLDSPIDDILAEQVGDWRFPAPDVAVPDSASTSVLLLTGAAALIFLRGRTRNLVR